MAGPSKLPKLQGCIAPRPLAPARGSELRAIIPQCAPYPTWVLMGPQSPRWGCEKRALLARRTASRARGLPGRCRARNGRSIGCAVVAVLCPRAPVLAPARRRAQVAHPTPLTHPQSRCRRAAPQQETAAIRCTTAARRAPKALEALSSPRIWHATPNKKKRAQKSCHVASSSSCPPAEPSARSGVGAHWLRRLRRRRLLLPPPAACTNPPLSTPPTASCPHLPSSQIDLQSARSRPGGLGMPAADGGQAGRALPVAAVATLHCSRGPCRAGTPATLTGAAAETRGVRLAAMQGGAMDEAGGGVCRRRRRARQRGCTARG
jgi:hypothetical protein